MKVSIVLPVYNGEETLKECLQAILDIDYPQDDYELVVVNDGSTDSTKEIINNFLSKYNKKAVSLKFIEFEKNKGRIKARMTGAKNSKYGNLLFIDHRCIVEDNILKEIKKKAYEPLIGNPYQEKRGGLIRRFFYVFRKLLYRPYWGAEYPDVYIDEDNFDKISKGFSPFYTKKERFFDSLPEDKGKWVSDDTLIFANMVKEGAKILKTSDIKALYKEREQSKDFFYHIFQRGPRFVDYYKNPTSRYFGIIPLIILSPFFCISLIIFLKSLLLYVLSFILIALLIYLLLSGFSLYDFLSLILIGPLVLLSFSVGVYKGVFRLIFKK